MKQNTTYNIETKKYKFSFFNELHNSTDEWEFDNIDDLIKFRNEKLKPTFYGYDIEYFLNIDNEEVFKGFKNLLTKFKQILNEGYSYVISHHNPIYTDPSKMIDFLFENDTICIIYDESDNRIEILKFLLFNFKFIPVSVIEELLSIIIDSLETKSLFELIHLYYNDPTYYPNSVDIKFLFNRILEYKYENFTNKNLPVPERIESICEIL